MSPGPRLPKLRATPRRTMARLAIAFGVALAVSLPVLAASPLDAGVVFVLTFAVAFVALLLITNP